MAEQAGAGAQAGSQGGYGRLMSLPVPRRLALASIPADFADWLDYAAIIALLVFAWGEGPFVLAFFALAMSLPYVAIGPFLAAAVDRAPLARVLLFSNLGRALTTLALVFAGNTALVLALVFVRATVDSAFTPARQAAIQASTPPDLLASANGLHHAINQTSKIVGPAAGGLLLAFVPAQTVFGINALLSLIAAALVLSLSLPRYPAQPSKTETRAQRLSAGFAEFRRNRRLAVALGFAAAAYFSFFLYDTLIALLAEEFGFDATVFGVSIAVSGAGGLIGSLVAGRFAANHPMRLMFYAAIFGSLVTTLLASGALTGFPLPMAAFLLAMGLMGGSSAFMIVPYRTIIQTETPQDRMARVFAAGEAVMVVAMLSAPFIGSGIATSYGTGTAFLVGGVCLVLLGAVSIVLHRPAKTAAPGPR